MDQLVPKCHVAFENVSKHAANRCRGLMVQYVQIPAQKNLEESADTMKLIGSVHTKVFKQSDGGLTVIVGSEEPHALAREYGSGIYAESGDGRQTPWFWQIKTAKWSHITGKPVGTWVKTWGQPTPAGREYYGNIPWLRPAFEKGQGKVKQELKIYIVRKLKEYLE